MATNGANSDISEDDSDDDLLVPWTIYLTKFNCKRSHGSVNKLLENDDRIDSAETNISNKRTKTLDEKLYVKDAEVCLVNNESLEKSGTKTSGKKMPILDPNDLLSTSKSSMYEEPVINAIRSRPLKQRKSTSAAPTGTREVSVNEDQSRKLQTDEEGNMKLRLRKAVVSLKPISFEPNNNQELESSDEDETLVKNRATNLQKALGTCCDWFLPLLSSAESNRAPPEQVLVIDNKRSMETLQDCIYRRDSYDFQLKSGSDPSKILAIAKPITNQSFSMGFLVLDSEAEKGMSFVGNHTIVYWIRRGTVEVTINDYKTHLNATDSFFVPAGNAYNILNLTNVAAEFVFFQMQQ
ncbi:hypothetical protein CHUAL_004775 [Chamberlinius hualienensis]